MLAAINAVLHYNANIIITKPLPSSSSNRVVAEAAGCAALGAGLGADAGAAAAAGEGVDTAAGLVVVPPA